MGVNENESQLVLTSFALGLAFGVGDRPGGQAMLDVAANFDPIPQFEY